MAFVALQVTTVTETPAPYVKTPDVEVNMGVNDISPNNEYLMDDFGLEQRVAESDDLARPNYYKWTLNKGKKTVYTVNQEAAYTFTAAVGVNTSVAGYKTFIDAINSELGFTKRADKLALAKDYDVYTNGSDSDASFAPGNEVEIYLNADGDIETVVIVRYELAQITKLTTLKTAEKFDNEDETETQTIAMSVAGGSTTTVHNGPYFADMDYARWDYVLVAMGSKNGHNAVLASKPAEIIEGKITAQKSNGSWIIDNAPYWVSDVLLGTVSGITLNNSGTWVLDAAGDIAAEIEADTSTTDFAFVYTLNDTSNKNGVNNDGIANAAYSATVYVVLQDGTKASYPVKVAYDATSKEYYVAGDTARVLGVLGTPGAKTVYTVVPYGLDADGNFVVGQAPTGYTVKSFTLTDKLAKGTAIVDSKYASADTVYVACEIKNNSMTVNVVKGYKNATIAAGEKIYYVANDKNALLYVFSTEANESTSTGWTYALYNGSFEHTKAGSTDIYTYTVIVNGDETENTAQIVSYVAPLDASVMVRGNLIRFRYDADDLVVESAGDTGNVAFLNGTQLIVGSTVYAMAADAPVYEIITSESGVKSVADGTLAVGQTVAVNADADNNVISVFITKNVG